MCALCACAHCHPDSTEHPSSPNPSHPLSTQPHCQRPRQPDVPNADMDTSRMSICLSLFLSHSTGLSPCAPLSCAHHLCHFPCPHPSTFAPHYSLIPTPNFSPILFTATTGLRPPPRPEAPVQSGLTLWGWRQNPRPCACHQGPGTD